MVMRRRTFMKSVMLGGSALALACLSLVPAATALPYIAVLIAFVGLGDAFFNPASTAIVPDLVPDQELAQANALLGTMYVLAERRGISPVAAVGSSILATLIGLVAGLAVVGLGLLIRVQVRMKKTMKRARQKGCEFFIEKCRRDVCWIPTAL